MLSRISIPRVSQLASRQLHVPVLRNTFQRRFASTEPTKLVGAMDNAFNRERLAVKAHAAQSAGMPALRGCLSSYRLLTYHSRPLAEALHLVCFSDTN